MKKLLFLSIFFLLFTSSSTARAHVLLTDHSIGAVVHIDPDDDPIVGQPSSFFFEFKDKDSKFKPQDCSCTFSILENGQSIYSQPLFEDSTDPSALTAHVSYTFQKRGVYSVTIYGRPTETSEFHPFTLVYDLRVSRTQTATAPVSNSFITRYSIYLIGAGGLLFFFLWRTMKKRHTEKEQPQKEVSKHE